MDRSASASALYNKRVVKEIGIVVRANMHSILVDIKDGSSRSIENVKLFFSPNVLFVMVVEWVVQWRLHI